MRMSENNNKKANIEQTEQMERVRKSDNNKNWPR